MKRLLFALFLFAVMPVLAFGQGQGYTNLSGNLPGYQNGSVQASYIDQSGSHQLPLLNGSVFPTTNSTTLDSSGNFNLFLADNMIILPAPSQWKIIACMHTGSQPLCCTRQLIVTGASQNMTSQLANCPQAPGSGEGSYYIAFTDKTLVTVLGTVHKLGLTMAIACYDFYGNHLDEGQRIDPVSYTVSIRFAHPQTGYCALVAGGSGNGGVYPGTGFINAAAYDGTFSQLAADPNTQNATIVISTIMPITADTTVTNDRTLFFTGGGAFSVSDGATVTINSNIIAPTDRQIFYGAGAIAGLEVVHPEWGAWSVFAAVNATTSTGTRVVLLNPGGTYLSGFPVINPSVRGGVTLENNLVIQGGGQSRLNSGQTAFLSGIGSIIQGEMILTGSNIYFTGFSMDSGDDWNQCTGYVALGITNNDWQSVYSTNVQLRNISTLGCDVTFAPGTLMHSILIEDVDGLVEENITTTKAYYGNVIKSRNVYESNMSSTGSISFSNIIKSDDIYGESKNVTVKGIQISNGGPICVDTFGGTVDNVTVYGLTASNMTNRQPAVLGEIYTDPDTGVPGVIHNVRFIGGSVDSIGGDAVVFNPGATEIQFSDFHISNVVGNGVVFQSIGPSNNRASNLILENISLRGVYGFGNSDSATNIDCINVTIGCLAISSGGPTMPGVMTYSNVQSDGPLLYQFIYGSFVLSDIGAWQAATLAGTWSNTSGTGNAAASYRVERSRVFMRGVVSPGAGTLVMALPVGFRPPFYTRLPADGLAGATVGLCEVTINPVDGTLSVNNYATCATTYLSLDGLSFPTN